MFDYLNPPPLVLRSLIVGSACASRPSGDNVIPISQDIQSFPRILVMNPR